MGQTEEKKVQIIADILKYSRSGERVCLRLAGQKELRGAIEKFDGRRLEFKGISGEISLEEICEIFPDSLQEAQSLLGKRICLEKEDGAILDGVLYQILDESVVLITETGAEHVPAEQISGLREFYLASEELGDALEGLEEFSAEERRKYRRLVENLDYEAALALVERRWRKEKLSGPAKELSGSSKELSGPAAELCQRLAEAKKAKAELKLPEEDSDFYRGAVVAVAEKNAKKACGFLKRECREGNPRLKAAAYRILVTYLTQGDMAGGVEAALELFPVIRTIQPEYDQSGCLKLILNLFQETGRWDDFARVLALLLEISWSHPQSCLRTVQRYLNLGAEHIPERTTEEIRRKLGVLEQQILPQIEAWEQGKLRGTPKYKAAVRAWLENRETEKAERLFLEDIAADCETKGTTILTYVNMKASECGLGEALELMEKLRQEIRLCERGEKIAFYEKKYSFSFALSDYTGAIEALNTLQNFYYNKTKLGSTWYRFGECYFLQSRWKHAKTYYEKAAEYRYMLAVCEKQILLCRRNMGESVEAQEILRPEVEKPEDLEEIRRRVEEYYDNVQYQEAAIYIRDKRERYPRDPQLRGLAEQVEEIAERARSYGTAMPMRKDNHSIALRAWRVENDTEKAGKYFEREIEEGGKKQISCMLDLAEMLTHTKGSRAAIDRLNACRSMMEQRQPQEQVKYYERLYNLYLRDKDTDGRLEALEKLEKLYIQLKKEDRAAFAVYRSGLTLYEAGRFEETIVRMEKARTLGYAAVTCEKAIAQARIQMAGLQPGRAGTEQEKEAGESGRWLAETEFFPGLYGQAESFFGDRYGEHPVGISMEKMEQEYFSESDVAFLEKEAWQHRLRERTGFFGTAAYIENQINGNSMKYYELLGSSANSWGLELQENGNFSCACACFLFALQMELGAKKSGEKSAMNYLASLLGCRRYTLPGNAGELYREARRMMGRALELEGKQAENAMKELVLLEKSAFLRGVFCETPVEIRKIWTAQLANFIGSAAGTEVPGEAGKPGESEQPGKLWEILGKRCRQDENRVLDFISRVKNSQVFDGEQLTRLRELRSCIYVLDADGNYLDTVCSAYEKAIEIYQFEDFDNRMATIASVRNQLTRTMERLSAAPTYFGVYFLQEIVDLLMEILSGLSRKTREELRPELSVAVPVSDVPVVDGQQGISVTVCNRENAASARDVRLTVADVEGRTLLEEFLIAPYLKGGRSASREFRIPAGDKTYSIKLRLLWQDHEDRECVSEQAVSISSDTEAFEPIVSPYFTGDSIGVAQKEVFVGRDLLLDTLEHGLRDGKSSCEIIYGQKRCGKSSVANFLEDRLKEQFLIVKFSVGAARAVGSVYLNVKDLLVEKVEDLLEDPRVSEKISEEVLDEMEERPVREDEEFVSFMRYVHRKVCRPLGKEILLMIDEFTHLYRYVKEDRRSVAAFMDTWKKLLEAGLFRAVLIGQDTMPNFIREFQNQFQVTRPIRVDRLDDESVRTLIEEPLRLANGQSRFLENSVELIAGWFYGQPYYIQLYCNRLVEQMNQERRVRVTNALAEKVKAMMLEEAEEDLFDNLISRGDESGTEGRCYEILRQIAALTKNSEWADMGDISAENKDALIADLLNRSVIRRREKKCRILIPFFREWLNLQ